ncbi:NFACT RNA binding domain-containing protein [Veillonella sp.]|uniref:Rqc2 family fibronectin-binding protein n=1 Tax=Veillonella sp. TaxID=1926307 RepID=UPI0029053308|nr:NFACT RNA binding domain-containing protein [Veillonella sp.]MDU1130058.1 NFACT RNA binding domain-containing protein [Veillonella sp.]MDU2868193.1 NFACT RNA binding domain-containing protein [Veillonella sp.]
MNLDGLTMSVLAKELNERLQTGQIQKLYQIDKTTLLFKIRALNEDQNLIITVGATPAMYLSKPLQDLPKEPSSLCMFLRKHIEGSRIVKVEQINGDRIMCIQTDKLEMDGSITSTLIYVELMGKYSNCIFVQDGVILESLIHVSPLMNRERSISPKLQYELPPNANRVSLMDFDYNEIRNLLVSFGNGSVQQSIRAIFNGFGKPLLNEVLYNANLNGDEIITDLEASQVDKLANALYDLKMMLQNGNGLLSLVNDNHKKAYSTFILHNYNVVKTYETISEALEETIHSTKAIHTADKELEKILTAAIKKEEGRHQKIKDELEDTNKMDTYKLYGDLLMINAHLQVQYEPSIELQNLLSDEGEMLTIPLKPNLTIVENAQWYYKLYTKLKNRMVSGEYQLNASTTKLEYLKSILYSISLATTRESLEEIRKECMDAGIIKKSKKPLSYKLGKSNYIHLTIDEGEMFIGRNNQQNEYLTHRFAKPTDIWFHTQDIQGSHLILRLNVEPDDMILSKVAQYAAYFSKARETSKVPVDYTYIKNIKKPPGSPLGFVIFNTHQTMIVEPKKPDNYTE